MRRKNTHNKIIYLFTMLVLFGLFATGCSKGETKGATTTGSGNVASEAGDEDSSPDSSVGVVSTGNSYADYIRNELHSVEEEGREVSAKIPEDNSRVVNVTTYNNPDPVSVSSSESDGLSAGDAAVEGDGTAIGEEGTDGTEEGDGTTPDTFDVGTSSIYINGENDSAYATDIIASINKARTDLGYEALTEKDGLDKCADRRTREITCGLSHMRPNGQHFTSLAPQYFKAEMLAAGDGEPAETVDAWIKDLTSRDLVFTNKYTSVGAACFKCNGLKFVVVAFGY